MLPGDSLAVDPVAIARPRAAGTCQEKAFCPIACEPPAFVMCTSKKDIQALLEGDAPISAAAFLKRAADPANREIGIGHGGVVVGACCPSIHHILGRGIILRHDFGGLIAFVANVASNNHICRSLVRDS